MSESPSSRWANERVRAARTALVSQDAEPALAMLAEARDHPEWRAHYVGILSGPGEPALPALRAAMSRDPDNPDVCLLIGATLSSAASDARGSDTIDNTSEEQIRGLRFYSGQARQALHRAANLLPSDPVPWCELLSCAMSAREYRGEVDDMWAEIVKRGGDHLYDANRVRLLTLTRKWGGSEKECFEFARDRTRSLPPGHPLLALVPLAHVEALSERLMNADRMVTRLWHLVRYLKKRSVRAEVDTASNRLLAGAYDYAQHPAIQEAHQAFAYIYHHGGNHERARMHLEHGGERSAGWPWVYFGDHEEEFAKARKDAGLAP